MKKRIINFLKKLSPFYEKPFSMYGYRVCDENGNGKYFDEKELKAKNDKIERNFAIARFIIYGICWFLAGLFIDKMFLQ